QEPAGVVDGDADHVEAEMVGVWAIGHGREPRRRDPPDLGSLAAIDRLERGTRPARCPPGLDLDEREQLVALGDQIELTPARPVVAGQHPVSESLEVRGRELLAAGAQPLTGIGGGAWHRSTVRAKPSNLAP